MKSKLNLVLLVLLSFALMILVSVFMYREFSPQDQSAATTYYLSPNGNDNSGNGSKGAPWRSVTKANSSVSPGDTVILLDGNYPAYQTITKNNTTWKAENKHMAVLDGGFPSTAMNDNWDNIVKEWNNRCKNKNIGQYNALLSISNASGVTIDGIFLRNGCGRGLSVLSSSGSRVDNITIQNSRIDWTFNAAVFATSVRQKNFKFLDNDLTRMSIGDEYNVRVPGSCGNRDSSYCVNISVAFGGEDTLIKGNLMAWGEGEVTSQPGSKNHIFEDNILIGNKNSYYLGMVENVTARNNIFISPEGRKTKAGGKPGQFSTGMWRFGLRNERGHHNRQGANKYNTNVAIYNNLIINTSFFITGTNGSYVGNNNQVYFGNNTVIAGKTLDAVLRVTHGSTNNGDPALTGLMENNIFDIRKNPNANIVSSLSGNDKFTYRNNIWPASAPQSVRSGTNITTNDPGMVNPLTLLDLEYPDIGPENINTDQLRNLINIDNYRLKNGSPAINAGSTAGGENNTQVPNHVRSQDFLKNSRVGIPDIGAFEYGGVFHSSTPTPIQSSTPTPTQTNTPTAPGNTNTPKPTATRPPSGNACGKSDLDGDGKFEINDFQAFAQAYGMGNNSCADTSVNYGACGGRDVNKDGILDIVDFGGAGIGFAQRYYPKTSCAL